MSAIVQANYEELEQLAARFAAAAERHMKLLEQVNRQVDVLRNGSWEGRGVVAFLKEMDGKVSPGGQRLCSALRQASETTKQIVEVIRTAEEDAARPFTGQHVESPKPIFPSPPVADDVVRAPETPTGRTIGEPVQGSQGAPQSDGEIRKEVEDRIRGELGRLPNENGEQCVRWVQDRVEKVTGRRPPPIGNYGSDIGADNYRFMFNTAQFREGNVDSLLSTTSTGAILVWTRGQLKNNAGHVAVVEKVTNRGVWISEANWDANQDGRKTAGDGVRFISREELGKLGLHLVPAGTAPATPGEFAERKRATI